MGHLLRLNPRDSEIGDLHSRFLVDHDVRRLDVAMHDAAFVRIVEAAAASRRIRALLPAQRFGLRQPVERGPVHELHSDIGDAIFLAHIVDGDDIRMRKDPGGVRLAK